VSNFWNFDQQGGTHSDEIEDVIKMLKPYLDKISLKKSVLGEEKGKMDNLTILLLKFLLGNIITNLKNG
jgi:hypothetical protein